jgi:hypothetical protein
MEKIKILSVSLIRNEEQLDLFNEDYVKSKLRICFSKKKRFHMYILNVIENRKYLFPPGVYELKKEYSPKFKKYLWEFKDIPNRTEIKFHEGSNPSHSRGCPLLSLQDLNRFHLITKGIDKIYINVKLK